MLHSDSAPFPCSAPGAVNNGDQARSLHLHASSAPSSSQMPGLTGLSAHPAVHAVLQTVENRRAALERVYASLPSIQSDDVQLHRTLSTAALQQHDAKPAFSLDGDSAQEHSTNSDAGGFHVSIDIWLVSA